MSELDVDADSEFFELRIARFTPKPRVDEFRIKTVDELDNHLASVATEPMLAIGLGRVVEDADWGHFLLLISGERAWVHLTQGHCLTARDPNTPATGSVVRFHDDVGVAHKIASEDTISRTQGLQALRCWLPRGENLPELVWG